MLAELLIFGLTPSTYVPGRFRLVNEAIGLWSRGHRCKKDWAPHQLRTKTAIESVIDTIEHPNRVAVLGSGPLRDVPLAALSDAFEEVLLVDIVHLLPAYYAAFLAGNAKLKRVDLSGMAALQKGQLDVEPMAGVHIEPGLDLVISLNLASQLGQAAPEGLEREVIRAHFASLLKFEGRVMLITDVSYVIEDRHGHVIETFDLMYGEPMPAPDRSWTWVVCPFGEEASNTRRVHTVYVYEDWKMTKAVPPDQLELDL